MKFKLTSPFGELHPVRDYRPHTGIDLSMPEGTELRSIGEGVIERVVDYGAKGIGKGVIIRLEDGTRATYGHMSIINVDVGDKVGSGELIGLSGNTGLSTGPHLHFSLFKDGEFIDTTPLAEMVAEMSGEVSKASFFGSDLIFQHGIIGEFISKKAEGLKESATEATYEIAMGILKGIAEVLVDLSFSIALIGSAVMILLAIGGWKDGYKWVGVLQVLNVIIRMIFGGVT